jgi:spermidine synthase
MTNRANRAATRRRAAASSSPGSTFTRLRDASSLDPFAAPYTFEPWLLPLFILFTASGAAALIYEIVWFQLLQLVIGSSAVSLAVLLGTFMGGMCLGSLLLPRVFSSQRHPLRVYAVIEVGIAGVAILVRLLMPLVGGIYTVWGGFGLTGFLLRGAVAAVCLLPPTVLMGATLPVVARWVETTRRGVSWLGFLYGGNIAGAVFGSLIAGFYLLRVYDMATATYVAVAINLVVAGFGLGLATLTPQTRGADRALDREDEVFANPSTKSGNRPSERTVVYVVIGLSGLCALAAEALWTRQLGLLFGPSVYTFSIILAVFLGGLGIGSGAGSFLSRNVASPLLLLGWCQLLVAGGIAWAAYMLSDSLPYWPIAPSISSIWFNFQLDLFRAFVTIFPATLLWGASFPLALAAVGLGGQDAAKRVGAVYAANTAGAIAGAVGTSLLLVALIGSQHTQQLLIVLTTIGGLLVLGPAAWRTAKASGVAWIASVGVVVTAALGMILIDTVPPVSPWLVAYGRFAPGWVGLSDIIYVGEGLNASVAVSRQSNGALKYHNSGKVQASSEPQDMRLQRLLGHLTTLVPTRPQSVFMIGLGAGITAGAVAIDPRVEHLTIAEIEPLVPHVASTYFSELNYDVAHDPKVQIRVDDARHYLLASKEKFDAITSDLVDPWVKGVAMLFTTEFFQAVKAHLKPGGVVTLFVQLYETNPESVKSEVATFFEVFPNGVIFGNTRDGTGYDMILLGRVEPIRINLDQVDARLKSPEYARVSQSLREIGIASTEDLFASYAGRAAELSPWLADATINRDSNLRLQYLAGMGLNLFQNANIYSDILTYRRFPDIFTGSDARLQALWEAGQGADKREAPKGP